MFHPLSSLFILFGIFMECQVCIFSLNSLSGRGEPSSHQPALAAWVMMDAEWSKQVSDMGSGDQGDGLGRQSLVGAAADSKTRLARGGLS